MTTLFTEAVVAIIRDIPEGKVMTYGQIAELAGSPRGARQVVRVLHAMSQSRGLPWHRVVNRNGEIAHTREDSRMEQETRLREEGVRWTGGRIDLEACGYSPIRFHP